MDSGNLLAAPQRTDSFLPSGHNEARSAQCRLVIKGATPEGKTELIGLIDGVRETTATCFQLYRRVDKRPPSPPA